VFKERHARVETGLAGAVQIDLYGDLCFQGITFYPSLAFGHGDSKVISWQLPENSATYYNRLDSRRPAAHSIMWTANIRTRF
jgi:hypothetical protein